MGGFSEDLKKLLLAGIGAAAITLEKSKEMVDILVQKGELTVEQGRVLNEELRRKIREKAAEAAPKRSDSQPAAGSDAIMAALEGLSKEQLAAVKAKIAQIEAGYGEGGKA